MDVDDPVLAQLLQEAADAIDEYESSEEDGEIPEEDGEVSGEVDDEVDEAPTCVSDDDPVPPSPRRAAMPPPPRQHPPQSRLAPSTSSRQPTSTASHCLPEPTTSQATASAARPAATSITMLADFLERHLEDDAQQSMPVTTDSPANHKAPRLPEVDQVESGPPTDTNPHVHTMHATGNPCYHSP